MAYVSTKTKLNYLNVFWQTIKVARPIHWIKNLSLFAALIFSRNLFVRGLLYQTVYAFLAFDFITSATYIFNDIRDAKQDQLHPIKKNRPIASGKLPISIALAEMAILAILALTIANTLNGLFLFTIVSYFILQIVYSLGAKNIPIIDILIIAFGFIIRVYAGAFVINAHLSVWFLLCVISTALFLASGKRRAEYGSVNQSEKSTRISLSKYSGNLLDSYVTMFGSAAWMSWALFTFFESPSASVPVWIFLAEISQTTAISKLLMVTIPVAIFGIMRYEARIFDNKSEAPEKLLLTDLWLVGSAVLWTILVVWILYGGVAHQLT